MGWTRLGAALLLAVITLAACGDSGGGLCDRLAGAGFTSEDKISVAYNFETEEFDPANEYVDFTADEVEYFYEGDIIESGEWKCSGDRVSFLDDFEADVIEEDGQLVLVRDGDRYLQR